MLSKLFILNEIDCVAVDPVWQQLVSVPERWNRVIYRDFRTMWIVYRIGTRPVASFSLSSAILREAEQGNNRDSPADRSIRLVPSCGLHKIKSLRGARPLDSFCAPRHPHDPPAGHRCQLSVAPKNYNNRPPGLICGQRIQPVDDRNINHRFDREKLHSELVFQRRFQRLTAA